MIEPMLPDWLDDDKQPRASPVPHIAICVPSLEDHKAAMSMALSALCLHTTQQMGIPLELLSVQHSGIAQSRNFLVDRALETPASHLLWWDADIVPPVNGLMRLLEAHKDIVGATYCQKVPPYLLIGAPEQDAPQRDGLQRFRYLPAGFVLVSRKVYETLPRPWYFETRAYPGTPLDQLVDLICDNIHTFPSTDVREAIAESPSLTAWLQKATNEGPAMHPFTVEGSEDANFCRKAKHYAFELWCDHGLTAQITHLGTSNITFGQGRQQRER